MARSSLRLLAVGLAAALAPVAGARGQCMLANPSFELPGTDGATFAGWNQFGVVGSSAAATHGAAAARVTGPDAGSWAVSAFWQRLDAAPGERWAASVEVSHSATRPLTGPSRAILNVEWRRANGNLISYESHTAADASTPPGEMRTFAVESAPAPPGTAATHFLLGVLQAPGEPAPDVLFDEATFEELGPPTPEERQWLDFPGGRTVAFAGRTWRVKGPGVYGPGPNFFGDGPECTWVDAAGRLHLTIRNVDGTWTSTEVALEEALGYGDYVFTTRGRLDAWHPGVILGMFLWQYGPCYDPADGWWNPYNEIDVEFGRFGDPDADVGGFVAQPWDFPGNMSRFDATFAPDERTSHAFRWLPDRVEFRSWRGGPDDEAPANRIHEWTYAGPHIPRPERPRVHVNFWRFSGTPAADLEVVVESFRFVPDGPPPVAAPLVLPPSGAIARLAGAWPNPTRAPATIRYALSRETRVELVVWDVAGRRVRTLVRGRVEAGEAAVAWDGRDDGGSRVASGVYLCRLRAGDAVETRRLVLLR